MRGAASSVQQPDTMGILSQLLSTSFSPDREVSDQEVYQRIMTPTWVRTHPLLPVPLAVSHWTLPATTYTVVGPEPDPNHASGGQREAISITQAMGKIITTFPEMYPSSTPQIAWGLAQLRELRDVDLP